jgi:hypothetical protein
MSRTATNKPSKVKLIKLKRHYNQSGKAQVRQPVKEIAYICGKFVTRAR